MLNLPVMKKFFKQILLLSVLFLPQLYAETILDAKGNPVRYAGNFDKSRVVLQNYLPRVNEFRGIWVAVVENIDFPPHKSAYSFQRDFCKMLDNIKAAGFTAVIFQIRSNCDAFYPTNLAPWSRWLTGTEGKHLGKNFDSLKFMIT